MAHLDEWGLGGRQFGSWVTWFLVGGDLYTAYTFVAVPALLFASGAAGFFAVPYTVIIYPMVFVVLVRLWSVSRRHGLITPADFVRFRSGSSTIALIVAFAILAAYTYQSGLRPGAHRVRQGHADLHRDHRGDHLHPVQAGRL